MLQLQKRLHQAAQDGNEEVLRRLLGKGVGVDCVDFEGNTALHIASANDRVPSIDALVRGGACIDASNVVGWTPLMQAARHAHTESVTKLLQLRADVKILSVLGMSALCLAADTGDVAIVRQLMDAGASCTDGQFSPVLVAAGCGHDAVLRVLLDRGASSNKPVAMTGVTPLMASVAHNSVPTTSLLLLLGADADATSSANSTALQIATACQHTELVDMLTPRTSVNKEMESRVVTALDAVCYDDLPGLYAILAKDPGQAEHIGSGGVTALLAAAVLGRPRAAHLLLQNGADIEARDDANGWTPLLHALHHRHRPVTQVLRRHGASLKVVTQSGLTAVDFALEAQDWDIVREYVKSFPPAPDWGLPPHGDMSPKGAGIKQFCNRVLMRFHKSSSPSPSLADTYIRPPMIDDLHEAAPAVILSKPILPHFPASPTTTDKFSDDEDIRLAMQKIGAPVHMTDISFRWSVASSSGLRLQPSDPLPTHSDTRLLLKHAAAELATASSSTGSSLTASTNTTVKTKRSLNTIKNKPSIIPSGRTAAEHLTLTLGSRQLTQVLNKLALGRHHANFAEQDIDFEAFVELTSQDLKELGVADQVTRVKIMRAIQSLRKKL